MQSCGSHLNVGMDASAWFESGTGLTHQHDAAEATHVELCEATGVGRQPLLPVRPVSHVAA
eukprot:2565552-Prymnesium_polylepis.1